MEKLTEIRRRKLVVKDLLRKGLLSRRSYPSVSGTWRGIVNRDNIEMEDKFF